MNNKVYIVFEYDTPYYILLGVYLIKKEAEKSLKIHQSNAIDPERVWIDEFVIREDYHKYY
jgi:hypothetical protein